MRSEDYKCLKCDHEFQKPWFDGHAPGPGTKENPTECPMCGHLWVKWLSYEKNHKRNPRHSEGVSGGGRGLAMEGSV